MRMRFAALAGLLLASLLPLSDSQDGLALAECDFASDCEGLGLIDAICDRFGAGKEPNNGDVMRRGDGLNGQSYGRCVERPPVPTVPEFGYFTQVLNRTYTNNFTKANTTYERVSVAARDCTNHERNASGCMADTAVCRFEHGVASCLCMAGTYGDPLVECTHCPHGVGRDGGVSWQSTSTEGSTTKTDCRTPWISHWDTITLSNEVITVKLDQKGLRSSVFNDVSPKWSQALGGEYGDADPGSGDVSRRSLHECRDSAVAANNLDDLSSHCRHLIGVATGNAAEEGSGRVFRYTADEFKIVVTVLASSDPTAYSGEQYALLTGNMALSGFKVGGTGKDCGRADCGGTVAVYTYRSTQEPPAPHHELRNLNAFRADVKGPRGYVRSTHRPYGSSPARAVGTGGAPANQPAIREFEVVVTYTLEPGDEFVRKEVAVEMLDTGVVTQVQESEAFHKLVGCQVLRPNDDCPNQN